MLEAPSTIQPSSEQQNVDRLVETRVNSLKIKYDLEIQALRASLEQAQKDQNAVHDELIKAKQENIELTSKVLHEQNVFMQAQRENEQQKKFYQGQEEQMNQYRELAENLAQQLKDSRQQLEIFKKQKDDAEKGAKKLIEILQEQGLISLSDEPVPITETLQQAQMRRDAERAHSHGGARLQCDYVCKMCGRSDCIHAQVHMQQARKKSAAKAAQQKSSLQLQEVQDTLESEKARAQKDLNEIMRKAYANPDTLALNGSAVRDLIQNVVTKNDTLRKINSVKKSAKKQGL